MKEIIHFRKKGEAVSVLRTNVPFSGNAFLPKKALVPIAIDRIKAIPVVTYGQYVKEGEIIARAADKNSTNIRSPIPGIIGDVCTFQTGYGSTMQCVSVFLEGRFNMLGKRESNYTWRNTGVVSLLHIIDEKGLIVTKKPFTPLATALREAVRLDVRHLQFTMFDFDESCGLEHEILKNFLFEVLEGVSIVARILECSCVEIFITKKLSKETIEKITQLFDFTEVVFTRVKNTYPFYDLTKRKAEPTFSILPSTAIYVYEAIVKDRPFVGSYILLSGKALKNKQLLKVRFGTIIGNLLEECGGLQVSRASLIINGFLNGAVGENFDTPIHCMMKSITVIPTREIEKFFMHPCAHCGRCANACPMNLDPSLMITKIRQGDFNEEVLMQLRACINCNVCSSCCPSRLPIADIIAKAKEEKYL